MKTFNTKNGLYFVELLARRFHGNPQTSQTIAKVIGYFPQPNSKTLLLKATLTYISDHGEVKLVPN